MERFAKNAGGGSEPRCLAPEGVADSVATSLDAEPAELRTFHQLVVEVAPREVVPASAPSREGFWAALREPPYHYT